MDIATIAKLEESRLAIGLSEISDHVLRIKSGGIACRALPGWWNNTAAGIGMSGPVEREEIEELARWYEGAGIEPRIEGCPLADPSLFKHCEDLNFRVRGFDNVLYRELSRTDRARPAQAADPTISIRIVNKDDDAEVRAYSRLSMAGFSPPDFVPPESDFDLWARVVKHPRTVSFIGSVRDSAGTHDAAAGAIEVHEEIACLFGLSTLAPFRKRGLQQSLIAARLNLAADRGVRVATIGSRPGAGTERNVRRMGFQTAYTKVFLTRAGPGLAPNRG